MITKGIVISPKDGVNAVINKETNKFVSKESIFFYLHMKEYGFSLDDFDEKLSKEYINAYLVFVEAREAFIKIKYKEERAKNPNFRAKK